MTKDQHGALQQVIALGVQAGILTPQAAEDAINLTNPEGVVPRKNLLKFKIEKLERELGKIQARSSALEHVTERIAILVPHIRTLAKQLNTDSTTLAQEFGILMAEAVTFPDDPIRVP